MEKIGYISLEFKAVKGEIERADTSTKHQNVCYYRESKQKYPEVKTQCTFFFLKRVYYSPKDTIFDVVEGTFARHEQEKNPFFLAPILAYFVPLTTSKVLSLEYAKLKK